MEDSKVDMYDFGCKYGQVYTDVCSCGKKHEVSTQRDDCPEYHTTIYLKCGCGRSIGFSLPVN